LPINHFFSIKNQLSISHLIFLIIVFLVPIFNSSLIKFLLIFYFLFYSEIHLTLPPIPYFSFSNLNFHSKSFIKVFSFLHFLNSLLKHHFLLTYLYFLPLYLTIIKMSITYYLIPLLIYSYFPIIYLTLNNIPLNPLSLKMINFLIRNVINLYSSIYLSGNSTNSKNYYLFP
jgi:hypothetical protein